MPKETFPYLANMEKDALASEIFSIQRGFNLPGLVKLRKQLNVMKAPRKTKVEGMTGIIIL